MFIRRNINYGAPINRMSPLNKGLVGWWKVLPRRYGGLTWFNLAGFNHATLTSMGTSSATSGWNATTHPGGYGELRFDGTNDWANLGNSHFCRNVGAFTFTCWVKFAAVGTIQDLVRFSINNGGAASTTARFGFHNIAANTLELFGRAPDSQGLQTISLTGFTTATGIWYHFTAAIDYANDAGDVYLNGVALGKSGTFAFTNTATDDNLSASTAFGAISDGSGNRVNGFMDDIRLIQRIPDATEAMAIYRAALTGYKDQLNWIRYPVFGSAAVAFGLDEDGVWYVPTYT